MTESEKIHLKEVALRAARDLHPNTQSPQNMGTMGYALSPQTPPSVETVLTTAKTIYEWLSN